MKDYKPQNPNIPSYPPPLPPPPPPPKTNIKGTRVVRELEIPKKK